LAARFWSETKSKIALCLAISSSKKGENILDFGCGRGEMLVRSAQTKANTFGVDYASCAIKLSKEALLKNNLKAEVLKIKDQRLFFKDNFFDVVFLLDVVEHLYPQELEKTLAEVKRVLRPQGRLIIHTGPNKEYLEVGYKYFSRYLNFLVIKNDLGAIF